MDRSIVKKGKLIIAALMAVGMMAVNTGCTVSDLVDAVSSKSTQTEEVTVKNVSKFLDAIKPNTEIVLKEGEYNFSTELKDLYGRDGNEFNKSHDYVKIEAVEDGYQIIIENVSNLTIESKKGAEVNFSNISSSAGIFNFIDCDNITIKNINVSHNRNKDNMNGEVMAFENCKAVELSGVNMSGAKGYGITLDKVSEFKLDSCEITKCKAGAINARKCTDVNIYKCKIYENEGNIISASSSELKFLTCDFIDNTIEPAFISKSADNSITFKVCTFGATEAAALNSGEVAGDEGYSFDDSCEFAEVPQDSTGAGGRGEYEVASLEEFFAALGPDRTIIVKEGTYDVADYFDTKRSPERWADDYEYINVFEYSTYYSVTIYDCDNLTIVGEGNYNDCKAKFNSSTTWRSVNIRFDECDNLKLQNIEFENRDTYSSYFNFIELYECKGGEISAIKSCDTGGFGIEFSYCEGDWYIYDSEFWECGDGAVQLFSASGNWYFDGCKFCDNNAGMDVSTGWYQKNLSFKHCYFDYVDWAAVNYSDSDITIVDCTHEDVTDEYMLIEYENIVSTYVDADTLTDTWYGYLYLEEREIYSLPSYDSNGVYRTFKVTFYTDGTGLMYIGDNNAPLDFEWSTDDYDNWMHEVNILVEDNEEYVPASAAIYTTEDDIVRLQLYYDGIYYLCW